MAVLAMTPEVRELREQVRDLMDRLAAVFPRDQFAVVHFEGHVAQYEIRPVQ